MEDTLKTITEGFLREKSLGLENLTQRIAELKEYLKLLDSVSSKITEIGIQHRKDISSLIEEKVSHQKLLEDIKATHAKEIVSHVSNINEKQTHSDRLDKEILIKEGKVSSLDRQVQGLLSELSTTEVRVNDIRGMVSTLERNNTSLKTEETKLAKSIESLKSELTNTTESVEEKKKEATRLSNDIAILEARLK